MGWLRRLTGKPDQAPGTGGESVTPDTGAVETGWPVFIEAAGASMTTRNVVDGVGRVRFMVRDPAVPSRPADNGWRVFGEHDTDEYVADADNLLVVDFNQLCAIEPALVGIWDFPVGSELELRRDDGRIRLIDVSSDEEIPPELHYVPERHRG